MLDDEVNYWPTRTAPFFAPNFKLERQKTRFLWLFIFVRDDDESWLTNDMKKKKKRKKEQHQSSMLPYLNSI